MARENTVFLYGRAYADPKIKVDEKGEALNGKLFLTTIRRTYATQELMLRGDARYDVLCVFSRHKKLIDDNMYGIERGDMVYVKGTLCTYEVKKYFTCPYCGHVMERDGVTVFVDPIFVKRCEHGLSDAEAMQLLDESDEISNQVRIAGTLCREPILYRNSETDRMECDFQIASNRNRHILEDDPMKRTDYPWVKCFKDNAVECSQVLHTNSDVYINGAIQARNAKRPFVCEECGETFRCIDRATEIIPYNIEYLRNCDVPDSDMEEGYDYGE